MQGIRQWLKQPREQTFVHMATYRFHEVFPGGLAGRVRKDLVDCILAAVRESCERYEWRLVAWDVLSDRVEVLLTGREPRGENGETVAATLDTGVYEATGARAVAN